MQYDGEVSRSKKCIKKIIPIVDPETPPILIAACGNLMAGDDEFGPLVAQALQDMTGDQVPWINIINLEMKPTALMDYLPGPRLLIVVDAAQSEAAEAGRLIDIDWFSPNRPPLVCDAILSCHGMSIADNIELARRLDVLPDQVHLVAVTIGPTRIGGTMRHEVRCQVSAAAEKILTFTRAWLAQYRQDGNLLDA